MKRLFDIVASVCVFCLAGAGGVSAQNAPKVGFIRIVNGIAPGQGNAKLLINGEDIFPEGYQLGQATGAMGLKEGSVVVEAKREGVESGTTNLDIRGGETTTLIAFAEKNPQESIDDPPKWSVKLLRLKQSDPLRGYRVALVSICDTPEVRVVTENLAKNTKEIAHVKRLSISMVDLGTARGEAFIKDGDNVLTTVSTDSPGNYVVILYQDKDGKLAALTFYDPKFVVAG